MFPDRKTALQELAKAEELNPGPWGEHSRNVAHAAELIAAHTISLPSSAKSECPDISKPQIISSDLKNVTVVIFRLRLK